MLAAVLTALAQVLVFSAVPFLTYLVTRRRAAGFLRSAGFYRPETRTVASALLVFVTTPRVLLVLARPDLPPRVAGLAW